MPGYVIHIAVAQEYLKKSKLPYSIDFIKGTIAPDLTNNKKDTHYGKLPRYTNLNEFLTKNELNNDYMKGYFLHLITDYLFYNYYLEKTDREQLHSDYDCLNKKIMDKYNVILVDEVKQKVFFKNDKPVILSEELVYKVIDEVSELNLEQVKQEVLNNIKKWNYYKK